MNTIAINDCAFARYVKEVLEYLQANTAGTVIDINSLPQISPALMQERYAELERKRVVADPASVKRGLRIDVLEFLQHKGLIAPPSGRGGVVVTPLGKITTFSFR